MTIWIASLALCLLVYLAVAKPGPWYSAVPELGIAPSSMRLARGDGALAGSALVVSNAAQDGNAVISVSTAFAAHDYARITWEVRGLAPGVSAALLWNTDVEPGRVNRVALTASSGTLLPASVASDPHWLGNIRGLALVLHGRLEQPVAIFGTRIGSGDAWQTLRARFREWLAFRPWDQSSINTVPGGSDDQRLPLPLLLAVSIAIAAGVFGASAWFRARATGVAELRFGATEVVLVFLACWLLLDLRWQVALARHVHSDALRFAGRSWEEKHLALDDSALFAFTERARAILPPIAPGGSVAPGGGLPARVFVLADSDYLRGRAAYYLYPWNVWRVATRNVVPPADRLHAGDWIVVYQRRGVEYDASTHHLRWDGGKVLGADLKLLDHGGALFELR